MKKKGSASTRKRVEGGSRRLAEMASKRRRAYRLGIALGRSANFELPGSIKFGGERKRLSLPPETGVGVAFSEILFADCYGVERVQEPVHTVLDVGANVGLFCLAARRAFPTATIHAYEPNSALEEHLANQARIAG